VDLDDYWTGALSSVDTEGHLAGMEWLFLNAILLGPSMMDFRLRL
jgi:hypothetical protein